MDYEIIQAAVEASQYIGEVVHRLGDGDIVLGVTTLGIIYARNEDSKYRKEREKVEFRKPRLKLMK